jgi:hypothetical protein
VAAYGSMNLQNLQKQTAKNTKKLMKQNEPEKVSCNQLIASITEELEATLEVKEAAFGRQVSLNTLAGDGKCLTALTTLIPDQKGQARSRTGCSACWRKNSYLHFGLSPD